MCEKRFCSSFGTKPSPAATSSTDKSLLPPAAMSINRLAVEMPPNHRLNQRKSLNEAATSDGVPESVSSSSRVGRRCIRRIVAERERLVVRQLTVLHHGDTETQRKPNQEVARKSQSGTINNAKGADKDMDYFVGTL